MANKDLLVKARALAQKFELPSFMCRVKSNGRYKVADVE